MKPTIIVDLKKLIIYPITIFLLLMTSIGLMIFILLFETYKSELLVNNTSLTNSFSEQITMGYQVRDDIILEVDNINLATARLVISHRSLLSNDYLAEQLEIMGVDNIWWYDSTGEVIFDAKERYIGWTPTLGDPIYTFMNSDIDEYVEEIRVSTDSNLEHKNVYIKDSDGSFVQVSTSLETINEKLQLFESQNVLNRLILSHPELYFIKIIDLELLNVADTDHEAVGTSYDINSQYSMALSGQASESYAFYEKQNIDILEISAPIFYQDQIIGIINIGFSLNGLNYYREVIINVIITVVVLISGLFVLFQLYWIRRPLNQLSKSLSNTNNEKGIVETKSNIFKGLFIKVNQFIDEINEKNNINEKNIKKTKYISDHDFLTNLLNRRGFVNEIQEWVDQESEFAVFYIDIDNFKHYNDLKGHTFGDLLLKEIAKLLRKLGLDEYKLSRYGGDEFLVACKISHSNDVNVIVEKIIDVFNCDIIIDSFQCYLKMSVGVSFYPNDGIDLEEITENAEKAMIQAKKIQGTQVVFFNNKFKEETNYHTEITEKLINCITDDGFEMVYQPQVNTTTEKIIALEALLRIKEDNLSPGVFVPIAEKSGLMIKIGRIVITKVIEQIALWKEKGIKLVPVYINFSSTQLHDQSIANFIENLLIEHDISPDLIGVEITEDVFIEKGSLVLNTLKSLKKLGIHTAIDDFGSGLAGVNYLTNFEVNIVKIGKEVADKYLNKKTLSIYTTIVQLCDTLGFEVLAEGIETLEQIELLKQIDVRLVQGFYYYKPLKTKEIEDKLKETKA